MTVTRKRTNTKRWLFVAMLVLTLGVATTMTVFAKDFNNFTWLQSSGRYVLDLGQMSPGSNINTSGIKYSFVATSPSKGEFSVVLQYKGAFGIWHNVDGDYGYRTASQNSEHKYDPINGGYVDGQPNLLLWSTNKTAEYRIIMENATAPQATGFTRVKAWAY